LHGGILEVDSRVFFAILELERSRALLLMEGELSFEDVSSVRIFKPARTIELIDLEVACIFHVACFKGTVPSHGLLGVKCASEDNTLVV